MRERARIGLLAAVLCGCAAREQPLPECEIEGSNLGVDGSANSLASQYPTLNANWDSAKIVHNLDP